MSRQQLQAATDAAALAGAREIYSSTAVATAESFAATTGGSNYYSALQNVSMVPGWPKLECLTTVANMGILCEGPNAANAIQVKEQATVPTFFARVFGINQMTISAQATATKGKAVPLNVALLIDTTLSMNQQDSNCGGTNSAAPWSGRRTCLPGWRLLSMRSVSLRSRTSIPALRAAIRLVLRRRAITPRSTARPRRAWPLRCLIRFRPFPAALARAIRYPPEPEPIKLPILATTTGLRTRAKALTPIQLLWRL